MKIEMELKGSIARIFKTVMPYFCQLVLIFSVIESSVAAQDTRDFDGCTPKEIEWIQGLEKVAKVSALRISEDFDRMRPYILGDYERNRESYSEDFTAEEHASIVERHLKRAQDKLSCIASKMGKKEWDCQYKPPDFENMTCGTVAGAHSIGPIILDIKINTFWFEWRPYLNQVAMVIHEYAHLCRANDKAHFTGETLPFLIDGTDYWYEIADTYSYFLRYGTCFPGINCRTLTELDSRELTCREMIENPEAVKTRGSFRN